MADYGQMDIRANIPYLRAIFTHCASLGLQEVSLRFQRGDIATSENDAFLFYEPRKPGKGLEPLSSSLEIWAASRPMDRRSLAVIEAELKQHGVKIEDCAIYASIEDAAYLISIGALKRTAVYDKNDGRLTSWRQEPINVRDTLDLLSKKPALG